jgi:hypothetical protein
MWLRRSRCGRTLSYHFSGGEIENATGHFWREAEQNSAAKSLQLSG